MHRMRRLREPGMIHRRRRNCSLGQCLPLRHSGEVSQASIRRLPRPRSARFARLPAREFCLSQQHGVIHACLDVHIIPKYSDLRTKIPRLYARLSPRSPPAGPSGLSQPDARHEQTDIRASTANLTRCHKLPTLVSECSGKPE